MKKNLVLSFFTMVLMTVGFILVDHRAFAGSQVRLESDDVAGNDLSQLSQSDDLILLTGTEVFTFYFPIIFTLPPPNPKKGVGVTASPACADIETLKASWYFNWGPFPDRTCGPDESDSFVPRIYNAERMKFLPQAIVYAQDSGWLIGFSEPNLPWQGNMSPREGAILWRQIEQAAIPAGVRLVSPSPNQWDPGQNGQPYGHQWLWAMVDEYRAIYGQNPHFDAIGWNIYKRTAREMQDYLTARRNEALARGYDAPIWILEYGGRCVRGSIPEIQETMRTITPWFDATPWIGRYAWYANRVTTDPGGVDYSRCSLIDPRSGNVTAPGQIYSTF